LSNEDLKASISTLERMSRVTIRHLRNIDLPLGVEDEGYPRGLSNEDLEASISTLKRMSESLSATTRVTQMYPGAHGRKYALLTVTRNTVEDVSYVDLRIAGEDVFFTFIRTEATKSIQRGHRTVDPQIGSVAASPRL
jgi:GTPase